MERPTAFVGEEISFDIRRDIMHVDMGAAGTLAIPLDVFERAHARSGRCIREYRAKKAKVVRLPRRRKSPDHAANP